MVSNDHHLDEVKLTAAEFASRHITKVALEIDQTTPSFVEKTFAEGLQAGFHLCTLPEAAGGTGLGALELCGLVSKLAESCAGHAMLFGVHAAGLESLWDARGEAGAALLECVQASGKPLAVVVPDPVSTKVFGTGVRAKPVGKKGWDLHGDAGLALNVVPESSIILFAKQDDGTEMALVAKSNGETLQVDQSEPTLGLRAMPVARIRVDHHCVSESDIIAVDDQAVAFFRILMTNLCAVTAAAAVGLMATAFAKAASYASERYQGGKMIIDHSHLRSILGSMSADLTASEAAAYWTATQPRSEEAALSTKLTVTERAVALCTDAVQILGGYGYMAEYGLEKAMRDAAVLALLPVSNARAELLLAAAAKEACC